MKCDSLFLFQIGTTGMEEIRLAGCKTLRLADERMNNFGDSKLKDSHHGRSLI